MAFSDRKKYYEEFSKLRGNPVIVYITSGRQGANGQITQESIRQFIDQIELLPEDTAHIDLIINSYGGDGLASWRLITILREHIGKNGKLTCFVPYYAFSAATLFAVGCNEIFLHPLASLGPVDPQIILNQKDGPEQFSYEDVSAFTHFLKDEAGITEQKEKASLITQLFEQIKPSVIGASKRASLQSITMAEKLLKLHMANEPQKAEIIAEKLSKNYYSHGHAVTRSEAEELGLKILERDKTIENLLWKIFKDFEEEMEMNTICDTIVGVIMSLKNIFEINSVRTRDNVILTGSQDMFRQIHVGPYLPIKTGSIKTGVSTTELIIVDIFGQAKKPHRKIDG